MNSIRIAVIDDSPVCTKSIHSLTKKHFPDFEVVGSFNDPVLALSLLPELKPDLLLLDIEMPRITGFDVLKQYKNFNGGVIFITAHSRYAIQAFKFSAIDYLLKPVDEKYFVEAIDKFISTRYSKPDNLLVEELAQNLKFISYPQILRIAVSSFNGIEIVKIEEIIYFKAENNYTRIKRQQKEDIIVSKTLKNFEAILADTQFIRIHNAYFVNFDKVLRFIRANGGYVVMEDGSEIVISRSYKDKFISHLNSTIKMQHGKD